MPAENDSAMSSYTDKALIERLMEASRDSVRLGALLAEAASRLSPEGHKRRAQLTSPSKLREYAHLLGTELTQETERALIAADQAPSDSRGSL